MDQSNPGGILDNIFQPENVIQQIEQINRGETDEQYADFFEDIPQDHENENQNNNNNQEN